MNNNGYTSEGYLKVRVTEANGTIPVENAVVTVSEYTANPGEATETGETGDIIYSLRTNSGGLTETVTLPTPPAADSENPGAYQPYAVYNVTVDYPGFYSVTGVGVPIFPGVIAVQPVNLMPISEEGTMSGEVGRRMMIFETPDVQSLQPGGLMREDIGNQNGTVSGGMMQENNGNTRGSRPQQRNINAENGEFYPDNANLTEDRRLPPNNTNGRFTPDNSNLTENNTTNGGRL